MNITELACLDQYFPAPSQRMSPGLVSSRHFLESIKVFCFQYFLLCFQFLGWRLPWHQTFLLQPCTARQRNRNLSLAPSNMAYTQIPTQKSCRLHCILMRKKQYCSKELVVNLWATWGLHLPFALMQGAPWLFLPTHISHQFHDGKQIIVTNSRG